MQILPIDVSIPSIIELLRAEYEALCRFVDFCESEQNAIIASDADELERLTVLKQGLLSDISNCRSATSRALGEPISPTQLRDKLFHAGHGAQETFDLIIAKALEAQEMTQLSARLVAHQIRRINGLSNALNGGGALQNHGYSANGFSRTSGIAASYGRA
jgi:hypothetical protein